MHRDSGFRVYGRASGPRRLRRALALLVPFALLAAGCWKPSSGFDTTGFASPLTRAPYLTDLVGTSVTVNWGTDRSDTLGSVQWGPDSSGDGSACSLSNTTPAAKTAITVGTVAEYQWKAALPLGSGGTYCYRVYLGATDLTGTNAAMRFQSQVPAWSGEKYSFAVIGDWGQVDANGQNPGQARLMNRIRLSDPRFIVTVGDNGYMNGNQLDYGDLQQTQTSAIFGRQYWPQVGGSVPTFAAMGNHGLGAASGTNTELVNWPEDNAVSTSGGRYQRDLYCCVNGSDPAYYGSAWYAFNAGPARYYVLQAAWGDTNTGTSTVYGNDYAAHWSPTSAEYQWLANDLATHPAGLKFAFFHYPLYSDESDQTSDTFLSGPTNLEGLLAQNNVSLAFNGHAHIYERNTPAYAGGLTTYVTGGGGGTLQPVGTLGCSPWDAYAIGWSPTNLKGYACGAAPLPTSDANVYHFLLVTVNGNSVTVTPTDSQGNTFDVRTYTFANQVPDTVIDSGPGSWSNSTDATFVYHSTVAPATYECTLDGGAPTPCPFLSLYSNLDPGPHTFTVAATAASGTDPTPAVYSWTIDTEPPTAPSGLAASAPAPFQVNLTWNAATDDHVVASYQVVRDGTVVGTSTTPAFTDTTAAPAGTYTYTVIALDAAGNASAPSDPLVVTTPAAPPPVFADGFESGNLSAWGTNAGLTAESTDVHSGTYTVEGNTANGNTFAKKMLGASYADGYARTWFEIPSQAAQVNLLRLRGADDSSIGYLYVTTSGQLGFHNDNLNTNTVSATTITPGWHALELHLTVNGSSGVVEVWLDGASVSDLSAANVDLGSNPIGEIQIGDVQSGRTYDVLFDDVAFGVTRIGP